MEYEEPDTDATAEVAPPETVCSLAGHAWEPTRYVLSYLRGNDGRERTHEVQACGRCGVLRVHPDAGSTEHSGF